MEHGKKGLPVETELERNDSHFGAICLFRYPPIPALMPAVALMTANSTICTLTTKSVKRKNFDGTSNEQFYQAAAHALTSSISLY